MATDIYEIWERYDKSKKYMDGKSILSRTEKNWQMIPLHVEFQGAHIIYAE